MIAASEPLEFVPHGRTVLANHPPKIYSKGHNISASENSLLYKLTNFDIRDESWLGSQEVEDKEWWSVREVFYRMCEEPDEISTPARDNKFENLSESFQPPSRVKNEFNISIKSELMSGIKSMDVEGGPSAPISRAGSANCSSNLSKKFNLNTGQSRLSCKGRLDPKTDSSYEEELYVKGCTAVWSKGLISTPGTKMSSPEYRETISCYTLDKPIKHAGFCNFYVTINNTTLIDALNSQIGDVKKNIKIEDNVEHIKTTIMPSIFLMDNKSMKVYTSDGREYVTSIPFQVRKAWPTKYGILLEKKAQQLPEIQHSVLPSSSLYKANESYNSPFSRSKSKLHTEAYSAYEEDVPLPTCFSLSHPLDEVAPILIKSPSHGLQYYNDSDLQIMFVSTSPSVILTYDWKLATHSLWRIRKTTRDECFSMCNNMNSTFTAFSQSCDFVNSPMPVGNNATSWVTGIGSPYHSRRGIYTPNQSRSRQNSPMASIFHQQGMTPHTSIGQASSVSMMANSVVQTPPSLPLYPDICLDHIWTDSQPIRRDPIVSSDDYKTFLHTDMVGHSYLCFMVKSVTVSKLQIMRLRKSHSLGNNSKTNLIVGSSSTVYAKDAVPLEHLKMIALIDEAGNIMLQSGNNVVGKVHVGGVLARLIDSPYTKRNNFQSPFPRRSSLLPSRTHDASSFDDSALHLLSPVPHTSAASRLEHKDTLGLSGVRDAAGSRLTLQFETGAMYRIALPCESHCGLVEACRNALIAALPKDISMQVLIKWYGVRNAPGTQDLNPDQEWSMFSQLIYSLIGYDVEKLTEIKPADDAFEPIVVTKKQRTSCDGSQEDWDYLLNSKLHKTIGNSLAHMLNMNPVGSSLRSPQNKTTHQKPAQFNSNGLLFPYMAQILYGFHLVYEELKLNTLLASDLKPLSSFLYQLAKDLKLDAYVQHYWLDFPAKFILYYDEKNSQLTDAALKKLTRPSYFTDEPPNVFNYVNSMLKDIEVGHFPYLPEVNNMTKDVIEVLCSVGIGRSACARRIGVRDDVSASTPRARRDFLPHEPPHIRAVHIMCERGITTRDLKNLPPAIGLLFLTIASRCKSEPPVDWPPEAYNLVMREDLALQAEIADSIKSPSDYMESLALEVMQKETAYTQVVYNSMDKDSEECVTVEEEIKTGMEHLDTEVLKLLYPRDRRTTEVFRLLQSSVPVTINLTQRPEVSDHDFIEEQEKHLYGISTRTMALPVARGMVTLRSLPCAPTKPLTLPKLCVSGRGLPPRSNTITLGGAESSQCLTWPSFHNGVAAGLALVPITGSNINSSWIIFNKPRGTAEMSPEHAGFLMALGLNGHLKDMPFMNLYEYLVKCNEIISVGLLLGIAATYKGTMDIQATKTMSIHLEPLLPPTSIELDIQQNILVAALMGVGLIYQDTGHMHYAHVLLNEIGKPPGPEMENCIEREGYALAAGLALGFICVGRGGTHTHNIAHVLRLYMLGGDKRPTVHEGAIVNLDVTSPGATIALGLMYLRSNNTAVAQWLHPPTTPYALDFVRPDLLMLRVIARGLVLWDSIKASEVWVEDQVPSTIKPYCLRKPTDDNIDYEATNQAYCNIVAGACFAMGLRFAGSGNKDARDVALNYVRMFIAISARSVSELFGRSTLEACMCVCLLSAGMVMAGRGDLAVLRLCRRLRIRVPGTASSLQALTHGGQMAVHCTMGLLFLGGGRVTLSTSPTAVAALVAAFFPKFPTHSEDNRYHLQAFRHLYVLAVEPRLLLPRDLSTGKLCYAHLQVIDLEGAVKELKAPCIMPELDTLKEVKINDPRYWPITFQRDRNWEQLNTFLKYTWCVDIKQRAGCLSYVDDPLGFLTIAAQTLTLDNTNIWSASPENIKQFTNDDKVRKFVKTYLAKDMNGKHCADCISQYENSEEIMFRGCQCRKYSREEKENVQRLSMVTYECVVKDLLCALPIWTTFLKIIKSMNTCPSSYHMWQIKLLLSHIENHNRRLFDEMKVDGQESNTEPLVSGEFTLALKQRVELMFDKWQSKINPLLKKYLGLPNVRKYHSCKDEIKQLLSAYIVFNDLPKDALKHFKRNNRMETVIQKSNLSMEAVTKLRRLLR